MRPGRTYANPNKGSGDPAFLWTAVSKPADLQTSTPHWWNISETSASQGFSSSSILASSDTEEQVFPGDNKARTELQNITYCTLLKDYTGCREKNSMFLLCHFTAQDNNLPEVLGRGRNRKHHWNRVESGPAWGFTSYLLWALGQSTEGELRTIFVEIRSFLLPWPLYHPQINQR